MTYPAGNRFAISQSDNRQAEIWIISLLSLMYSVIILAGRVTVKWNFLGLDDIALALAYVLAMAHWITVYLALQAGLGKEVTAIGSESIIRVNQLLFAGRILLFTCNGLTKCTVALFIRQVVTRENRRAWMASTVVLAIMLSWTIISPIAISISMSATEVVQTSASRYRDSDIVRWRTISSLDLVLECGLVLLPLFLFSTIQMSVQKRAIVISAFAFRIPNGLLEMASSASYVSFLKHGQPSVGLATPIIWQEILIAWSLMSATIPVLKGFVGRFATVDLVKIGQGSSGQRYTLESNDRSRTGDNSYAMTYMSRATPRRKRSREEDGLRLRPEGLSTVADAYHEANAREEDSIVSGGSEQMIIHRKVEWQVTTDTTGA
ncbi:hypothetical protein LTR17_004842 [Elasticomyces elasticus]|nr:hypothetical protein LTR17_004842 [Elasticomyces elasticus]